MVLEEFKINIAEDIDPLAKLNPQILKTKDIAYIILKINHESFNTDTPSHLINLMGKSVISYVKKVCDKDPATIEYNEDEDLISTIKPHLGNNEWTVVLFSDTPLITYKTLAEGFLCAENKDMNVVKLKRGYIFKTEYIKRVNAIFTPSTLFSDSEDFMVAQDFASLAKISDIMKIRILTNFMKNGVQIVDPNSTYIESVVTIDENSIIYPNACIMGETHIGSNSTIGYGSTIKNSVVGNRCNIQNSLILSSVVQDNTLIEQSTVEKNSLIEKNCVIKHYSIISSSKIGENSICSWAKVKNVEIDANTKLEN